MAHPLLLLAVLITLCCTVGYSMSTYHASGWQVVVFTIAALVSLQISYAVGLIVDALQG